MKNVWINFFRESHSILLAYILLPTSFIASLVLGDGSILIASIPSIAGLVAVKTHTANRNK